jgi:hypothetical protein
MSNSQIIYGAPKSIRVNLSSSFIARTKCRECGLPPDDYYYVNHALYFSDPRSASKVFDWFKKYISNIVGYWYKRHQPRIFHNMKAFTVRWPEQSYKPTLHQHRDVKYDGNITEYLSCPCGRTVWAFNSIMAEHRPEIKNRKARYRYPQKFETF